MGFEKSREAVIKPLSGTPEFSVQSAEKDLARIGKSIEQTVDRAGGEVEITLGSYDWYDEPMAFTDTVEKTPAYAALEHRVAALGKKLRMETVDASHDGVAQMEGEDLLSAHDRAQRYGEPDRVMAKLVIF